MSRQVLASGSITVTSCVCRPPARYWFKQPRAHGSTPIRARAWAGRCDEHPPGVLMGGGGRCGIVEVRGLSSAEANAAGDPRVVRSAHPTDRREMAAGRVSAIVDSVLCRLRLAIVDSRARS